MQLTSDLRKEYEALYKACVVTNPGSVKWYVDRIQRNQARYESVSKETGVPWFVIACIHAMESSFDFSAHLHNGDPLSARTVQVPKGRPVAGNPPFTWEQSAVDALAYDGATQISTWDLATICWFLEGFNGWGYRTGAGQATTPAKRSPYLWSMTNQYQKGKYVKDGKFDPNTVSAQAGCCAILRELENRRLVQLSQRTEPASRNNLDVGWFNAYLLADGTKFEIGIAAKLSNSDETFATARIPVDQAMVDTFLKQFPNARSVVLAEREKPWPGNLAIPAPEEKKFTILKLAEIAEQEAKKDISWRGNGLAKKYTKKFEPIFGPARFAWCAAFVTWCCEQAGIRMPIYVPNDPGKYTFALVEAWQQWAIRNGYWRSRREEPKRGWIVVFDWEQKIDPDTNWESHIGIFLEKKGNLLVCAEGNADDRNAIKQREMKFIQGYVELPDGMTFV